MRKYLRTKNILIASFLLIIGAVIFLFFDAFYGGQKFRTMQDKIYSFEDVDLTGLREIKASGGMLPRIPYVTWKLSTINDKIVFLDLKSEYHGYIRGIPSTFLGYHNDTPGLRHLLRRLLLTGSKEIRRDLVVPEEEELKKYGLAYKSINVGSKFITTDDKIDAIVTFFESVPENTWIHVHCSNGNGRTTTALAMLDIMKNAPIVALKDIIRRQYLLGSVDLFDTELWPRGIYTKADLENRKAFIVKFYDFICQRKTGGIQTWSKWNKR